MKRNHRSLCALSLLVLTGCWSVGARVDREVGALSEQVDCLDVHAAVDVSPHPLPEVKPQLPEPPPDEPKEDKVKGVLLPAMCGTLAEKNPIGGALAEKNPPDRLKVPPGMPGADAPLLPKFPEDAAGRTKYVKKYFPALPTAPEAGADCSRA